MSRDGFGQRGFCGIGVYNIKRLANLGGLWRSAQAFGASYLFTIEDRYKLQKSDISRAYKHVPYFHYRDWEDFLEHRPKESVLVAIENSYEYLNKRRRLDINYYHPRSAIYLLGNEVHGIPEHYVRECDQQIYIDTKLCLNVATCGSLVLYDRQLKGAMRP